MAECPLESPERGHCNWCGKLLRGRQTRWCSRKCSGLATLNHRWTQARQAARKRRMKVLYQCERCDQWVEYVEVNHKEPCLGKHSQWGCWNHQENLEVLCRPCHLDVTAEQRAAGKFKRG